MSWQRGSGFLLTAGLVLTIAASIVFPSEYYMAKSEAARQSILDANQAGWVATNWLWAAAGVVTAAGMLLFAWLDRDRMSLVAAVLFLAGSAFWVGHACMRSLDPSVSTQGLWMEASFSWLATAGLALMGAAFLRGEFPNWVGYANLGYGILFLSLFILFGPRLYEFFPPQVIYLVAAFTGIEAIRRG